jgi:1-aminocyclopropane-1-carboxylate deaminase
MQAGMIAGTALEGRGDRRIIGIDASKTMEKTVDQVTRIAQATAQAIGVDRDLTADEITIVDATLGRSMAFRTTRPSRPSSSRPERKG